MAAHDLHHLCSIWRPAGRRVDHLGGVAKILRIDYGWCDHAQRFRVPDSIVIEPVSSTGGNAECLARPDVDLFSFDGKRQHSVDEVGGLFVMIVAMLGGCFAREYVLSIP